MTAMKNAVSIARSMTPRQAYRFGQVWEYMAIQNLYPGELDWMVDAGFIETDSQGNYEKWTKLGCAVAREFEERI